MQLIAIATVSYAHYKEMKRVLLDIIITVYMCMHAYTL